MITYAAHIQAIASLAQDALRAINAERPEMADSRNVITVAIDRLSSEEPLTIALTGRYNAGKSTLIRCLTGADVRIDADVATSSCAWYPWNGVRLLDTPGVRSGESGHDAEAERGIQSADLVLFVVTGELFDPPLQTYFRHLATTRGQLQGMLLVVNKMAKVATPPEIIRRGVAEAIAPVPLDTCGPVLVDGRSFLDAQAPEMKDDRRQRLLEKSRIPELGHAIDGFAIERGKYGRLLSALAVIRDVIRTQRDLLGVDDEPSRQGIQSLARVRKLLLGCRTQLHERAGRLTAPLLSMAELAQPIIQILGKGAEQREVEAIYQAQSDQAEARIQEVCQNVADAVTEVVLQLQHDLEELEASSYVRNVSTVLGKMSVDRQVVGAISPARVSALTKKIPGMLHGLGSFLAKNQKTMHAGIYQAGKLIGVKFKPWGAAGKASMLAKAAPWLAGAGALLDLCLTIRDIREEERAKEAAAKARADIRAEFTTCARNVRSHITHYMDEVVSEIVAQPLAEIESILVDLRQQDESQRQTLQMLNEIDARSERLRVAITSTASPV